MRELKNVVERSLILSDHEQLTAEDIRLLTGARAAALSGASPSVVVPAASPTTEAVEAPAEEIWTQVARQDVTLDDIEKQYIMATLERHRWNKSATARQLGIERTTLDRKLKKYDITRGEEDE